MDITSLVGLLLAIVSLLGAFALEGGSMGMLLVLTAAIIVFGGTIAATVMSFTLEDIKRVPYFAKMVFVNKDPDYNGVLETLVTCADKARREGFLSLESQVEGMDNKFLARGIQMVTDGMNPELTRDMLEKEIDAYENNEKIGVEVFMTAGGFAPTMGIIGTVMGMITVLSNLSNPEELGGAIAVAFLATLYGIASANLMWIPFATKIKNRIKREVILMEMILEGILAIQVGENPRILRGKLSILLPPEARTDTTAAERDNVRAFPTAKTTKKPAASKRKEAGM
ncbi:MAG: flagellar motor protein [Syntrophomonadaceae bacterium]|nr:flagellar motor protein [Syntrophomonadaceae bacterium]